MNRFILNLRSLSPQSAGSHTGSAGPSATVSELDFAARRSTFIGNIGESLVRGSEPEEHESDVGEGICDNPVISEEVEADRAA